MQNTIKRVPEECFRILDVLVCSKVRVLSLFPTDDCDFTFHYSGAFNGAPPVQSIDEMFSLLAQMLDMELFSVSLKKPSAYSSNLCRYKLQYRDQYKIIEEKFRAFYKAKQLPTVKSENLYLGLNQFSAGIWERMAMPNWDQFDQMYDTVPHKPSKRIRCVHTFAGKLASEINLYYVLNNQVYFDTNRISSSIIRPWNPFYWKQLPIGYALKYEIFSSHELQKRGVDLSSDEISELNTQIIFPDWYTDPFPLEPMR